MIRTSPRAWLQRVRRSGLAAGSAGFAAGLLAFGAVSAAAQPAPPAPPPMAGHPPHAHGPEAEMMGGTGLLGPRLDRLLQDVSATDAQRQQIHDISAKLESDLRAQFAQLRPLHEQQLAALTKAQVDAAGAEGARQQIQSLQDHASKTVLQAMLDVSNVLTADQRARLGQHMAGMHQRMDRRRAAMAPPPPASGTP